MLEKIISPPADPILSLSSAFMNDPRTNKIDLGVGVYRDQNGQTPIMEAIKLAQIAQSSEQTSKAYIGLAGNLQFNQAIIQLLFDEAQTQSRCQAIQTPGGSGALRILAEFIYSTTPNATVWLTQPSYVNHQAVMQAVGLNVQFYPYFDFETCQVDVDKMLAKLAQVPRGDIVLIHGCCHNPTGADLSFEAWQVITSLAQKNGFIPFIDIAYQGFGQGLDEDAKGLRWMASQLDEVLVAQSCSKNFGLYRERTGLAMVMGKNLSQGQIAKQKLMHLARTNYTMPPDHGADLVVRVLQNPNLKQLWQDELKQMQQRVITLRHRLCDDLNQTHQTRRFDFIRAHQGMFSMLGFSPIQMRQLREQFGIYAVEDSRINIASLSEQDVPILACALANVGNKN